MLHRSNIRLLFADIERAESMDDLGDFGLPTQRLSLRLKIGLQEVSQNNPDFLATLNNMETARQDCGLPALGGRQVLWMVRQKFKTHKTSTFMSTKQVFYDLKLENDNPKRYMNQWTKILLELGDVDNSVIAYDEKTGSFGHK